jgi:alcohol dehydrogenase
MKALIYDEQLRLSEVPQPEADSGQVLIKVRKAGVCNTDLEIVQGYMGFRGILGHEFVGEVMAGDPQWIGKRVVGEINVADHTCDLCQRGIPSQCRNRTTVGIDRHPGAFAEYLALSTYNLYAVPDEVSDDEAVFVEPLAAALQILEATHISPRDHVVIVGTGKLGLLCAQVLQLTGAHVSAVARREKQAELVRRWGVEPVSFETVARKRAQVVVDCTGNAQGFADALELVEPRGTLVLKSTYVGLPQADLTRVVIDEIRVIGSRCGPFDAALRLLSTKRIEVEPLVAARYSLVDGLNAFKAADQPGQLKVLLEM